MNGVGGIWPNISDDNEDIEGVKEISFIELYNSDLYLILTYNELPASKKIKYRFAVPKCAL